MMGALEGKGRFHEVMEALEGERRFQEVMGALEGKGRFQEVTGALEGKARFQNDIIFLKIQSSFVVLEGWWYSYPEGTCSVTRFVVLVDVKS